MKAPLITVTCECGQARLLPWGARWECEACGRSWNTAQIPESDYRNLTRAVRRYQLEAIVFGAVLVAIYAPLIAIFDVRVGISGLVVFFAWAFLVRPRRRRRLVTSVIGGAQWQLHPE